ncbi:hypothetical protein HYH02_012679 [Chlamydomonas schloesseri]|uniref:Uncharacterized protein n=1 Tax=Chlamydomonas schloesseri TaxID=2026947 RepID=A0A835SY24_9CHLO|nr:hypothetical protein HYH02_012679 [Chlamydomonas schloesseri]|eukprot:KAG2433562.1 hypothetical protein HYH02_012679 [Chlamydomonas schloesseri]
MAGQTVSAATEPPALTWKLIGAAVWHAAAIGAANFGFALLAMPPSLGSVLYRPSGILTHMLLYGLQLASLIGHRAVLASNEFTPVTFPKLGIHGRTWISLFLTRVVVRGRTWSHVTATAMFFGLNALTGVAYCALYARLKVGPAATSPWSLWFGVLLGVCYSISYLIRGCDVLSYPVLQRHRWFRLKERIPLAVLTAIHTAAAALGLALLLRQSLLLHPRLLYGWGVAAGLCSLCWALGGSLLQLVFTERLQLARPGDADANSPLLAELASSNTIMQDLALLDLALTMEGQGGDAAFRRAAIFADESGRAAWGPVAALMLGEVRDFTAALAAALPSAAAEAAALSRPGASAAAGGAAGGAAAVRWNVLRMSPSTGLRVISREQDLAAWNVRAKYYRIGWCLRGLCGLTVAAQRGEDRFGVVLLCEPALPDIALALLSVVLVLQHYTKFVTATRSRHSSTLERLARQVGLMSTSISGRVTNVTLQPVDEVAFALEGMAHNAINRLALAYGDKLKECVLREARTKPAYGSPTELAALLTFVLA